MCFIFAVACMGVGFVRCQIYIFLVQAVGTPFFQKKEQSPFQMIKFLCKTLPLWLLATVACGSGQSGNPARLAADSLYKSIKVSTDTTLSYALYLPTAYAQNEKLPLILLFDPHADGELAVKTFVKGQKKDPFIIAGCNNTRNGMPTDQSLRIVGQTLDELKKRFPINEAAIYLGGFSGGARIANAAALSMPGIAGVVSCSAGPGISDPSQIKYSILGVAGSKDFNLIEMRQLDQVLDPTAISHHLIVFRGKHEWPSQTVVSQIYEWLMLDAMRQKSLSVDRNYVNAFIEKYSLQADQQGAAGNTNAKMQTLLLMKHFLSGVSGVDALDQSITSLQAEASWRKAQAINQSNNELEMRLFSEYNQYFSSKPLDFWKSESTKLRALAQQKPDTAVADIYARLLGNLSLRCYMAASSLLKQANNSGAAQYVQLYTWIDPDNPEHCVMEAQLAARAHQPAEVIQSLRQAINLGFEDAARLKQEPDFSQYQQQKEFLDLLAGLKKP